MKDEELIDKLIKTGEEHARRVFLKAKHSDLAPMWHLVDAQEKGFIYATPWTSEPEKEAVYAFMRKELKEKRIRAYSFIAEAWVARYEKDEVGEAEERPKVMPSKRPNRIEVVTLFACTRSKQRMVALEMKRKKGKVVDLVAINPFINAAELGAETYGGSVPSLFD